LIAAINGRIIGHLKFRHNQFTQIQSVLKEPRAQPAAKRAPLDKRKL
jgi:hypothetical protein